MITTEAPVDVTGVPDKETDLTSRPIIWALVIGSLVLVALNFRPWQGGLLEDWDLAARWELWGRPGFWDMLLLPATAGRPIHLLWANTGLLLSNGGFVGMYAVLAAVAIGVYVVAYWAIGPFTTSAWLRVGLAFLIAVHPWWPAGVILRFVSAAASQLIALAWFGLSVRWLRSGRLKYLIAASVVLAIGMLSYQAIATPVALAAVLLIVLDRSNSWRRCVYSLTATFGTLAITLFWSVIVAPRIWEDVYEASNIANPNIRNSLNIIANTAIMRMGSLIALWLLLFGCLLYLTMNRWLTGFRVWLSAFAVFMVPLSAMVFFANPGWLMDSERIAQPIGLSMWFVLAVLLGKFQPGHRFVWGTIAGMVVWSLVGGLRYYVQWAAYSRMQQSLLAVVMPVRQELSPASRLLVADYSGRFGDWYTFLEWANNLTYAAIAVGGPGASVSICNPIGIAVTHSQPVPSCEGFMQNGLSRTIGQYVVDGAQVELIVVE